MSGTMSKVAVLLILLESVIQLVHGEETDNGLTFFHKAKEGSKDQIRKIYPYNEAAENAYPFTVYLGRNDSDGDIFPSCTGSLIDREWVLTAAHCLGYLGTVVIADYDRYVDGGNEQKIYMEAIIPHPSYDPYEISNDIGLIKLASRVNIGSDDAGLIAPLASKGFFNKMMANEKTCRVTGWGNTYYDDGGWRSTNKLLVQGIRFANRTEAERRGYYMPNSAIAGEIKSRKKCRVGSICFGDSGGPTFCRTKGGWVQTGITSFLYRNDGCVNGLKGLVNVYMFSDWITETMNTY